MRRERVNISMDRLKTIAVGMSVGVVLTLAATLWAAHASLTQLNQAATNLAESSAKAAQTEQSFAQAVRQLESIGAPDLGSSLPTESPNSPLRLAPPFVVWDGDTFDSGNTRYRLVGIDAPGVRGRDFNCLAELYLGRRARDMLRQEFARTNVRVEVVTFGNPIVKDDYERTLVQLRINGEDFGQRLLRNDLGIEGNRRAGWCNGR